VTEDTVFFVKYQIRETAVAAGVPKQLRVVLGSHQLGCLPAAASRTSLRSQAPSASLTPLAITGNLASYGAAKRESLRSVEHRQHRRLNNRAENSHQPARQ
jgi:putative transposase